MKIAAGWTTVRTFAILVLLILVGSARAGDPRILTVPPPQNDVLPRPTPPVAPTPSQPSQPPSPSVTERDDDPHQQRPAVQTSADQRGTEQIHDWGNSPPSLINFVVPGGWKEISDYCNARIDNGPYKWVHEKFICDVHITDVGVAIFTGLLVIATVFLFVIGSIQAGIMGRSARRQLRAYVFVDGGSIQLIDRHSMTVPTVLGTPTSDMLVRVHTPFKNFGQTPAHQFTIWRSVDIWDPKAPQFGEIGDRIGNDIVGPGATIEITADKKLHLLSLRKLKVGLNLFLVGDR